MKNTPSLWSHNMLWHPLTYQMGGGYTTKPKKAEGQALNYVLCV